MAKWANGCSVTTTNRKISVRPINRISSATSFGVFLAFGAFDQGDHAVQCGLAGIAGDTYQQPVGDQPRIAGDGRAIAAGLADDRRRFAGDRSLVDRGDAFDHFTVAGDHVAGLDAHHITFAQTGGGDDFKTAGGLATCVEAFATGLEAVGPSLAAAFGQRFGEVGEQHGEPQPQRDLRGDKKSARRCRE
nr:hypothetical protein GCM10020185_08410 [Pseudomonas brassicacearum subsp. brassicacearum]